MASPAGAETAAKGEVPEWAARPAQGGIYIGPVGTALIRTDSKVSQNTAAAGLSGKAGLGGKAGSGSYAGEPGENGAGVEGEVNGRGGGILNLGTLTIEFTTITKNAVSGFSAEGGGIASNGTATISDSTISLNKVTATGKGTNGASGLKGTNGLRGEPGIDGEDGGPGEEGQSGTDGGSALGGAVLTITAHSPSYGRLFRATP